MNRRRFLGLAASTAAIAGCQGIDGEGMGEGSPLVDVRADGEFSGTIRIDPGCRDGEVEVTGGERVRITRAEAGETCTLELYVDDESVETLEAGRSTYQGVRFDADGEVKERFKDVK